MRLPACFAMARTLAFLKARTLHPRAGGRTARGLLASPQLFEIDPSPPPLQLAILPRALSPSCALPRPAQPHNARGDCCLGNNVCGSQLSLRRVPVFPGPTASGCSLAPRSEIRRGAFAWALRLSFLLRSHASAFVWPRGRPRRGAHEPQGNADFVVRGRAGIHRGIG